MASISGSVTIAGDPDDWIACAFDADTHAFAGVAAVSAGAYEITGLTAGKAYVVACRPKSGAAWAALRNNQVGDYTIPTDTIAVPYIFKAIDVAAGDDPDFQSVQLLLPCDGENNGTVFSDIKGHSVSVTSAVTKTDVKKFGTASAYFNGSARLDITSNDLIIGTQDFTLEFWAKWASGGPTLFDNRFGSYGISLVFYAASATTLYFFANNANRVTFTLTSDTWNHIAISRISGVTKAFLNGTKTGNDYSDTNNYAGNQLRFGNNFQASAALTGYLDDIRLTIGVGRYADSFTAPTAALPVTGDEPTGSTEPAWPTTPGNTVVDGGVTWTNMGQLLDPLIAGPLIAV